MFASSKKTRKRRRKLPRPVLATLILVIATLSTVGGTMAWFAANAWQNNPFEAAAYNFEAQAVDVFEKPSTPPLPNQPFDKRVGADNVGDVPAFVRLLVIPTITYVNDENETVLLQASFGNEILFVDLNSVDWTYGNDGYYYYLYALPAKTSTTDLNRDLFTKVKLNPALGDQYHDAQLKIEVKLEAIQTAKWDYRLSWWGSAAAPASGSQYAFIDAALAHDAV
ncbi:MAG: hypothetical protein LBJ11_02195 [Oscillospiraceae bacterium]|jgi:predicted ribosomally synthesized peptide with SipW-like signal peptide|nr:hypothetical protein [Oscillospiraceae bacterium]